MPKLPVVSGKEAREAFERDGVSFCASAWFARRFAEGNEIGFGGVCGTDAPGTGSGYASGYPEAGGRGSR